jgi:hypothetical protein
LLKRGSIGRPISQSRLTTAIGPPDRAVESGRDDTVMVAVGDEQ